MEKIKPDGTHRVTVFDSRNHLRDMHSKHVTSLVVTSDMLYFTMEREFNLYAISTKTSQEKLQIVKLGECSDLCSMKFQVEIIWVSVACCTILNIKLLLP